MADSDRVYWIVTGSLCAASFVIAFAVEDLGIVREFLFSRLLAISPCSLGLWSCGRVGQHGHLLHLAPAFLPGYPQAGTMGPHEDHDGRLARLRFCARFSLRHLHLPECHRVQGHFEHWESFVIFLYFELCCLFEIEQSHDKHYDDREVFSTSTM